MLKKFIAGACLGAVLTLGLGQQADAMSVDRYNLIDAYAGVAQGGDYAYDKIVVRDKNTYDLLGTYLVEKHGRYVYSLQGNQATAWYDEEHPF